MEGVRRDRGGKGGGGEGRSFLMGRITKEVCVYVCVYVCVFKTIQIIVNNKPLFPKAAYSVGIQTAHIMAFFRQTLVVLNLKTCCILFYSGLNNI